MGIVPAQRVKGRHRVFVKLMHPPLNWLAEQSPVGGITEHTTHWFGVLSVPGHTRDTNLPGPQSSGPRQGLHAARKASKFVLPEQVPLSVWYCPAGHTVLHRVHPRFDVFVHGDDWKKLDVHEVLHALHTRFTVGVHAVVS
jgi:hypothetical protein